MGEDLVKIWWIRKNESLLKNMSDKAKCKNCFCKCHCKDELHTDDYGVCTCNKCKCKTKKSKLDKSNENFWKKMSSRFDK